MGFLTNVPSLAANTLPAAEYGGHPMTTRQAWANAISGKTAHVNAISDAAHQAAATRKRSNGQALLM